MLSAIAEIEEKDYEIPKYWECNQTLCASASPANYNIHL
jgi:hypothetical protein